MGAAPRSTEIRLPSFRKNSVSKGCTTPARSKPHPIRVELWLEVGSRHRTSWHHAHQVMYATRLQR